MTPLDHPSAYVICIRPGGDKLSVMERKLYRRMPDPVGEKHGMIRVVDETDEDYLYPADWFIPVDLSESVIRAMEEARHRADFSPPFDDLLDQHTHAELE